MQGFDLTVELNFFSRRLMYDSWVTGDVCLSKTSLAWLSFNQHHLDLWNTTVTALDVYSVCIIPYKFCLTEFEEIKSKVVS